MKAWRIVFAAALIAAIPAVRAPAAPALSLPQITIALNVTLTPQVVGFDAARKLGAFADAGLTIKTAQFRAWSEIVQAMVADDAVIGFGASSLIRAVMGQNAPLRQIAMVSTRYPYAFHTAPMPGFTRSPISAATAS